MSRTLQYDLSFVSYKNQKEQIFFFYVILMENRNMRCEHLNIEMISSSPHRLIFIPKITFQRDSEKKNVFDYPTIYT